MSKRSNFLRGPTWVEWIVIVGVALVAYMLFFAPIVIE
jgi:hypothetical protein